MTKPTFSCLRLIGKTAMARKGILRAILVAILITSVVSTDKPKTKRPPPVLSNLSFFNLTGSPLLPGELNQGDGETRMSPRDVQRTVDRHNEYRGQSRASNMAYMVGISSQGRSWYMVSWGCLSVC